MKKTIIPISLCICLFLSACGGEKNVPQGEVPVIDIENAIQNPQELLLSDFGEKFSYVPLETTDESLIKLHSSSKMIVTDPYIFIGEDHSPILCFERTTGKFLRTIGSLGQGPGEYQNPSEMEVDVEAKRIYIRVAPSHYLCYDFDGEFLHTLTLPGERTFMMGAHYFADNKAYGYGNILNEGATNQAYAYRLPKGTCADSLTLTEPASKKSKGVARMRGAEAYGGSFFMVEHKDGTWTAGNRMNGTFQSLNGKLFHKDLFCDTLFQMKGLHREKAIAAFHLGSYGGYERYETAKNMEGKYLLPRVLHDGERIYFTLFTGMYNMQSLTKKLQTKSVRPGCGIYNLRTDEVKVQKDDIYFKHPEEGMPNACVYTLSTDGHWVAVYQAERLVEARENIPTEKQPEWLKNLKEDDNPVLLMIK
jgi:hypothetical protein